MQWLLDLLDEYRVPTTPHAQAYRLGGDEFCVLGPAAVDRDELMEAARDALCDQGVDWTITAAFGVVEITAEAASRMICVER